MARPRKQPTALQRFNDETTRLVETRATINLPSLGWRRWPAWQKVVVIVGFVVAAVGYFALYAVR